jgi:hypothetical protein
MDYWKFINVTVISILLLEDMDINRLGRNISIMAVLPNLIFANEEINFTHIIEEFSFGEYFPTIVNPLDYTIGDTTERNSLGK